jgi:Zn-dependent metalloprotease
MQMQASPLKLAILSAIAFPLSVIAAPPALHSAVAQRAQGLIEVPANAKVLQRADYDDFVAKDTIVDADGTEHVRFDRTYRGLPVIGGDVVVHSKNGKLKQARLIGTNSVSIPASLTLKTTSRPSVTPKIGRDEAVEIAGAAFPGTVNEVRDASLAIYAREDKPSLIYQVRLLGDRPANRELPVGDIIYYIDANNGKILAEDDQVRTAAAAGTGKTISLGNVGITTNSVTGGYELTDPSRGNGTTKDGRNYSYTSAASNSVKFSDTDNIWGNNATSDRATAAAEAHFGVAATWDYYKNTHGRNGIFNNGSGVTSYVHVGNSWQNAAWYNGAMYYGDGNNASTYRPLTALDVAGHEMSHGVNSATANLGYYNIKDSGGLNEGNSDIMGTLVEYSVNNASDPGDYLIGEEIYVSNPNNTKALRYMFKPDLDGGSYGCYPSNGFTASQTYQNGPYDPHYTSGVANRFFYLLAEGAVVPAGFGAGTSYNLTSSNLVCNGDSTITGIGREKAGKIWYRALTVYFTSSTTYPGARTATLNAASDLYGSGSAEYSAVARAWSAVSVN